MYGYPHGVHGGYVAGGYVAGAGYPRVVGYGYPGTGVYGVDPNAPPPPPLLALPPGPQVHPAIQAAAQQAAMQAHAHVMAQMGGHPGMVQVHPAPPPAIHSPPWRPMMAPGSPPLGEGHVPLPLTPEIFGGTWGGVGGAGAGTVITFSGRPQKPFKTARLIARGTKSGATAIGNIVAQGFVGTDLQQGELGFFDLESIGAANAFDTWVSFKQAEPGVWIRVQATLTAFPTPPDFETYTITAMGHYLH